MIVGKDTVMVRKRYDRSTKASPKEQAVVIAASELNRLRALDLRWTQVRLRDLGLIGWFLQIGATPNHPILSIHSQKPSIFGPLF